MATVVNKTIKSSGGNYASLNAFDAGEQRDLTAVDQIAQATCYAFVDSTAATLDGWVTDAARYINLVAATAHGGVWNTGVYRLAAPDGSNCLQLRANHVHITGLQFYLTNSTANNRRGIVADTQDAGAYIYITHCILAAALTGSALDIGILAVDTDVSMLIRNTLVYNFANSGAGNGYGIQAYWGTVSCQNVTIVDGDYGFRQASTSTMSCTNCGAANCTSGGFSGTITLDHCSGLAPAFVNYASDDFHLARNDTVWRKNGDNLTEVGFSIDIDGDSRGDVWDVGADEYTGVTSLPPTTLAPTTLAPTTLAPTTLAPTTLAPTTLAPTTLAPTTLAPTTVPTTLPTTVAPTTIAPTTLAPTTVPTTLPTTVAPTTYVPVVFFTEPLDEQREGQPAIPRVDEGDLDEQREGQPVVIVDKIGTLATTAPPTTIAPTTVAPTTVASTTLAPTTIAPTTVAPTTLAPTTIAPTTLAPTTIPTTLAPTTIPTTLAPTTLAPTTLEPTTIAPTTLAPTAAPTTAAPTTVAPTTVAPTTLAPTTLAPTVAPTTVAPTTLAPTTLAPTTLKPTTLAPTTLAPTTTLTTLAPTTTLTTLVPTTVWVCEKEIESEITLSVASLSLMSLVAETDSDIIEAVSWLSKVNNAVSDDSQINKEIYADGNICW